jgi:hypothetical protein
MSPVFSASIIAGEEILVASWAKAAIGQASNVASMIKRCPSFLEQGVLFM